MTRYSLKRRLKAIEDTLGARAQAPVAYFWVDDQGQVLPEFTDAGEALEVESERLAEC